MISILCAQPGSNYFDFPQLDIWTKERDAYTYNGSNPVIAHPPCQQWSRLKRFACADKKEKELAFFCLEKVNKNGGILEHPAGSSFFKVAGIKPTISVNQSWFGFPCRKTTYLYFVGCEPLAFPLSFDLVAKKVDQLSKTDRSTTTHAFASWLIQCVNDAFTVHPCSYPV